MQNIAKTIAAAAFGLALTANFVSADPIVRPKAECKNNTCEKFEVGMYRIKNTVSMNVMMEKEKGQKVTIRLIDTQGQVVHEEFVPKYLTKAGRRLNFSEMRDGDYTLEISNDDEKIVKSIHLSTNEEREVGRTLVDVN